MIGSLIRTRHRALNGLRLCQRAERQRQQRQLVFEAELLHRALHLKQMLLSQTLGRRRKPHRVVEELSKLTWEELGALQKSLETEGKAGVHKLKGRIRSLRLKNRRARLLEKASGQQQYPVWLQQSMRSLDTEALLRRRALAQDEAVLLRVKRLHQDFGPKMQRNAGSPNQVQHFDRESPAKVSFRLPALKSTQFPGDLPET